MQFSVEHALSKGKNLKDPTRMLDSSPEKGCGTADMTTISSGVILLNKTQRRELPSAMSHA